MALEMLISVVKGAFGSIGAKIGERLMALCGPHFGFLYSCKSNLENLKKAVDKLDEKRGAVQKSVDEAERNVKVIGDDVKAWLARVDECSKEAREILEGEIEANPGCLFGWCPNLKLHYSLGEKATKKLEEVAELYRDQENFRKVAYTEPLQRIEFEPFQGIKGFESRELIMNNVMEALKDDRFHMIGICGMGGVGKTTMVKEVAKRASEKKLFDEIVMAVVSQSPDERKIQGEIADKLVLQFQEETVLGRANRLHERLMNTKKILVVLDDVWKRLELNDIGIPFGDAHMGCKILLTSRSDDACNNMKAQKIFTVPVLTEEEAWNLFEEMAGISNDTSHTSTELYITQKKVAAECGRLPIAIVTVASTLKDKGRSNWNSALQQLRKHIVKYSREVEEKVFKSLELSYNFLESTEAKKCFLLFSLYPEDFHIPIEDVVRYGVGIELFESIDSVNEARDRVHAFVDDLKKCYLLIDSEFKDHVKMHDVVRDVAISIASREEHSFMVRCDEALKEWPEKERRKDYAVISLQCAGMSKLPDNLEFPKLHLLQLVGSWASDVPKIPDSLYGGMKELKSIGLLNMSIEGSLLTSLRWLTNLRSLSLDRCSRINDLSVIGALENLEILSFHGGIIIELPKEIGQLSHLKLLDLSACNVKRIYPGVLSSLSKLEELYLGSSFDNQNSIEETKATITELGFLNNFTTLVINLGGSAYWPRDLVLANLQVFNITIGPVTTNFRGGDQFKNRLILKDFHRSDLMECGFKNLFKITKILHLTQAVGVKNVVFDLDKDGFKQLTELLLDKCQDLEYLIKTEDGVPVLQRAFPVLQLLRLHNLDKLKEICHGQLPKEAFSALKELKLDILPALTHLWKGPTQLVRLRNLISVEVRRCDKLESLFSLSIARDLMQLQTLKISECGMMEVIISSEGHQHEIASATAETLDKIQFPKLKGLSLQNLASFTAIYKAVHAIELLPQLNWLELNDIPKLKSLCNASESNYDTIQPLFNEDVEYLFETAAAGGIPQRTFCELQLLRLCRLDKLTQICHGQLPEEAFSALRELKLHDLPVLKFFWKGPTQLVRLRNLIRIDVWRCDKLESLFSFSIAKDLMQLETLMISECRMMEVLISSEEGDQHEKTSARTETIDIIVFRKLMHLELRSLPSFTAICNVVTTIELPQLNRLKLQDLPKLKSLCNASERNSNTIQPLFHSMDSTQHVGLRNLYSIDVSRCDKLESICSFSMARDLMQLETLVISECRMMEVLISSKEGDQHEKSSARTETIDKIVFPKLKRLQLGSLPSFTAIFSFSIARALMQLETLVISECRMMEVLISCEEGDQHEITSARAKTIDKIVFPKLMHLELQSLPSFTAICNAVNTIELPQLNRLILQDIPKLKSLRNASERNSNTIQPLFHNMGSTQHAGLRNLIRIDVWRCDKLESLFSFSMARDLMQLQTLMIFECRMMEVLISSEGGAQHEKTSSRTETIDIIVFRKLMHLELRSLPSFTAICNAIITIELPQLIKLKLQDIPKLKSLCNASKRNSNTIQPLFHNMGPTQLVGLRNLCSIDVSRCDKLESICSFSIAEDLMQLVTLEISECSMVEVLIVSEEGDQHEITSARTETIDKIVFPKLMKLHLGSLPNFTAICNAINAIELPQLNLLELQDMPKLKSLTNALRRNSDTIQPLFHNKFIFNSNGNLTVTEINEKIEIWHNQLQARCLPQVRFMCVEHCSKLLSVVSSDHFIQRLHNIEELKIWWCDSLEIIFDPQEGVCADAGEEETSITKLSRLDLKYLPKLMRIWNNISQQTHCFKNLRSLKVCYCDNLRYIFTISMANGLVNLEDLSIEHCKKLEKIVTKENEEEETLLRQFGNVALRNLQSLMCFGPDVNDTGIPARKVTVILCPKFADLWRRRWR